MNNKQVKTLYYFNFSRFISRCKTSAHSLACSSGSGGAAPLPPSPLVRERPPLPLLTSPTNLTPDSCCARYLTSANELVACALSHVAFFARCRKQSGGVCPVSGS